jgi:GAF domain-containing protein
MAETTRETRLNAAFVALADTLTDDFDVVDLLQTLIEQCTQILDTEAGGLMLVDSTGHLHLVASTTESAELVEIMQLNAGAGPCVDCFTTGSPVTVGDIEADGDSWPDFRAEALRQGFRSVHATPMRLRGEVIGAMNLFGKRVGAMTAPDIGVAQALADVATIGILQERSIRESGIVAEQLQHALNSRVLIEQAKGVVSESAGVEMDIAFAALRDYARSHNLPLGAVAQAVVNREIDVAAGVAARKK